jgi:hypothetical protein
MSTETNGAFREEMSSGPAPQAKSHPRVEAGRLKGGCADWKLSDLELELVVGSGQTGKRDLAHRLFGPPGTGSYRIRRPTRRFG